MGTRTHQIEFEGDDREAVATAVRDGIGEELVEGDRADDLVREVAELGVETATEVTTRRRSSRRRSTRGWPSSSRRTVSCESSTAGENPITTTIVYKSRHFTEMK
jgi:16S rRNA U1498 N3-methylase RsmE